MGPTAPRRKTSVCESSLSALKKCPESGFPVITLVNTIKKMYTSKYIVAYLAYINAMMRITQTESTLNTMEYYFS